MTTKEILEAPVSGIQAFQDTHGEWSDAQFGGQTLEGKLAHLVKETVELCGAPHDIMEYADCFMLLLDVARKANITADALLDAAYEKLAINRQRKWDKPNEDGSVEHVHDQEK